MRICAVAAEIDKQGAMAARPARPEIEREVRVARHGCHIELQSGPLWPVDVHGVELQFRHASVWRVGCDFNCSA